MAAGVRVYVWPLITVVSDAEAPPNPGVICRLSKFGGSIRAISWSADGGTVGVFDFVAGSFHPGGAFYRANLKQLFSSCPRVLHHALQNFVGPLRFFLYFD